MANFPIFSTLEDACRALNVIPVNKTRRSGFIPANVGNSRSGRGDGRIRYFPDGSGGSVYNWQTGGYAAFFYDWGKKNHTPEEWKARLKEAERQLKLEAKNQEERNKFVAEKLARKIVEAAHPSENHPYLCRKRVAGFPGAPGIEIDREAAQEIINGAKIPFSEGEPQFLGHLDSRLLLVPLTDESGALWSLQLIDSQGKKAFLKAGRTAGLVWRPEGIQLNSHWKNPIALCEGVATALSVRHLYGVPCVAAISAGNLVKASQMLRRICPMAELWLCADRDENQTGEREARAAAEGISHSRLFVCPELTYSELEAFYRLTGSRKATDYNDYMIAREQTGNQSSGGNSND